MGPAPPPQRSGIPGWVIAILAAVGLLVAMIGTMAVLAIHGMRRYLATSKTAEALNSLGEMQRGADTAFTRDGALCKSASSPVPLSIADVSARKYMSTHGDWTRDPADTGFTCLGFELSYPQYYQYDYKQTGPDSFVALAHGDLNGNGITSEFSVGGHVVGSSLILDTKPTQTNPEE